MKRKLFYIIMILVFVMSLTSAASAQQGGLSPVPGSHHPWFNLIRLSRIRKANRLLRPNLRAGRLRQLASSAWSRSSSPSIPR